ncbi:MAG: hypothetical protein LBC37_00360 [Zoogloeaceae bacterium]|nr:hypothetical protein [Zoogloeaceae bacterium]
MSTFENPERTLRLLERKYPQNISAAEERFVMAQQQIAQEKVDSAAWSAAAEYGLKSLIAHPTGKAFLLSVEALLKSDAPSRTRYNWRIGEALETPQKSLELAAKWLDSAIAVEEHEKSLSAAGHAKLVSWRDCIRRYLETGKPQARCAPLQWAGVAQKSATGKRAEGFHWTDVAGKKAPDTLPFSNGLEFSGALEDAHQALAYLQASPPRERGEKAEKAYAHAQREATRLQWDAAARHGLASARFYPTVKALSLYAESIVRGERETREKAAALQRASGFLNTAVAVEVLEANARAARSSAPISTAEHSAGHTRLMFWRDCARRYLENGQPEAGCVPLQWAGVKEAPIGDAMRQSQASDRK